MPVLSSLDTDRLVALAQSVGHEILACRRRGLEIMTKPDDSPVTNADLLAHKLIALELANLYPDIPLLSEEGEMPPFEERQQWNRYWCLDPLDGTQGFIEGHDEFTINLALMEENQPVFGLLYAPALELAYYTSPLSMAPFSSAPLTPAKEDPAESFAMVKECFTPESLSREIFTADNTPPINPNHIAIAVSQTQPGKTVNRYLEYLESQGKTLTLIYARSALKFGYLAEGRVDQYPRFKPMMEWDTAAGHALALAVGKDLKTLTVTDDGYHLGEPLVYNKPILESPAFIGA